MLVTVLVGQDAGCLFGQSKFWSGCWSGARGNWGCLFGSAGQVRVLLHTVAPLAAWEFPCPPPARIAVHVPRAEIRAWLGLWPVRVLVVTGGACSQGLKVPVVGAVRVRFAVLVWCCWS